MTEPSAPQTTHVRALTALLASATRLVPMPLVDDWLRVRILRTMVARSLAAHGRPYPTACVAPLYEGEGGCVVGCLTFFFWLPVAFLLSPVRKIAAFVRAARGLSRDLTHALLLGRALDRALDSGMLLGGSRAQLASEARLVRRAFDDAALAFDARSIRHALEEALGTVRGLPGAAVRTLRAIFRARRMDEVEITVPDAEREVIDRGVAAVENTLAREDIAAELATFVRVFDASLRAHRARGKARPPGPRSARRQVSRAPRRDVVHRPVRHS